MQLDVGGASQVIGVNSNGVVRTRNGITSLNPSGTESWTDRKYTTNRRQKIFHGQTLKQYFIKENDRNKTIAAISRMKKMRKGMCMHRVHTIK